MKIATWNARGLKAGVKLNIIISRAKLERIDILFLQETNWNFKDINNLQKKYNIYASQTSHKGRGVAALILNEEIKVKTLRRDDRGKFLSIGINVNGAEIRCVTAHLSPHAVERPREIKFLSTFLHGSSQIILSGDFNLIFDEKERTGQTGGWNIFRGKKEMENLLNNNNLIDTDLIGSHTRFDGGKSTKLDRIFVSQDMCSPTSSYTINMGQDISDHKMVVGIVNPKIQKRRKGQWKIPPWLVENSTILKDLQIKMEGIWDTITGENWTNEKKAFCNHFEKWANDLSVKRHNQMKDLLRYRKIYLEVAHGEQKLKR